MKSFDPQESRNRKGYESFYRPVIARAGVVGAVLIVVLQVIGVLSRHSSGYLLIGWVGVLWLALWTARRLSDDESS